MKAWARENSRVGSAGVTEVSLVTIVSIDFFNCTTLVISVTPI
jgi:hypothetical protein